MEATLYSIIVVIDFHLYGPKLSCTFPLIVWTATRNNFETSIIKILLPWELFLGATFLHRKRSESGRYCYFTHSPCVCCHVGFSEVFV